MSDAARSRTRAAIVAVAPAVLLAVLAVHPLLPGRLPNDLAVAEAVAAAPASWGAVHLATAVASGLLIIAFLAIRSHLGEAGDDRYSSLGVPFIVLGGTLFAFLAALEFTPLAVAKTGGSTADIAAAQAAITPWFVGTLTIGALTFAVGAIAFAKGIAYSKMLTPGLTGLVVAALIIMALARFVPFSVAQFYVQGVAGIIALWPLAHRMWRHPQPSHGDVARVTRVGAVPP